MKTILFLLLPFALYAQTFKVVGDTATLKTLVWNQPVLLQQYGGSTFDRTGGGWFQVIDSAYTEGSYAFDHPWSGKQWARIGLIDPNPTFQTLTVSGLSTLVNLKLTSIDSTGFKFLLHTKAVGDSALGKIFLDRADTTIKMGTGSDLVTIKDLAP